ncbi:hypothetical protein [Acetohalobium arabaticum]|uniref:Polysaccharide deacetylase n=1 Tax=Acetohalobium arabaticum (strain ATCC 49924 / DSM 5501 / Z-7288) TaxID=574087 RepID=D9QTA6_ACEAZ|nr:hypothetical protein [Acetohalobium arabaticum]ADL13606.1 hypothetical protein Acear_2116 [Acetohalobium arabaticum DSM 5501]
MEWPGDKKFAFTIFDDTDNSTVKNVSPIYNLLLENNLKTTKSVWVYPPNDNQFSGDCLLDENYLDFVRNLNGNGFEIALHNVGSGNFKRDDIVQGIELFEKLLGFYPNIQVNHAGNRDNIYFGAKRFLPPFSSLYKLYRYIKGGISFEGEVETSKYFWGDIVKEKIKYIRNFTFNGINTLKYDPAMPYIDPQKEEYSNYWFSSSDGHTVEEFNNLIKKENVDKLAKEGGACIVYTHFASGFVNENGEINLEFKNKLNYLASKNGWFVPVSKLLDYLLQNKEKSSRASYFYLFKLNLLWLIDRLLKKIKYNR